jgi:hypothetical protein
VQINAPHRSGHAFGELHGDDHPFSVRQAFPTQISPQYASRGEQARQKSRAENPERSGKGLAHRIPYANSILQIDK